MLGLCHVISSSVSNNINRGNSNKDYTAHRRSLTIIKPEIPLLSLLKKKKKRLSTSAGKMATRDHKAQSISLIIQVDRIDCTLALELPVIDKHSRKNARSLIEASILLTVVPRSFSSTTLHDERGVRVALELFTRIERCARPPNRTQIRSRIEEEKIGSRCFRRAKRSEVTLVRTPPRKISLRGLRRFFGTLLLINDPSTDRSRASPSSLSLFLEDFA